MAKSNRSVKSVVIITVSWLLVILWAGVIFYLSSKSADESTVQSQGMIGSVAGFFGKIIEDEELMTNIDGIVRETAHGVEYFILGFLVINALIHTDITRKELVSVCVCTVYALSDEVHQIPIPGRAFQLMDLGIDLIGIVLGVIIFRIVHNAFMKRTVKKSNQL